VKLKFFILLLAAITFLLPLSVWTNNTDGLQRLFDIHEPPGQSWYLLSRLFGVLALSTACWQFVVGLSRKYPQPIFKQHAAQRRVHASLGVITFVLFWSHALCFVSAVSIRKSQLAYNLMLPNLVDYYHTVISIGWLALLVVTIAVLARVLKVKNKHLWHKIVYAVMPLAIVHSILVGSDTRDVFMLFNYVLISMIWMTALYCAFIRRKVHVGNEGVV